MEQFLTRAGTEENLPFWVDQAKSLVRKSGCIPFVQTPLEIARDYRLNECKRKSKLASHFPLLVIASKLLEMKSVDTAIKFLCDLSTHNVPSSTGVYWVITLALLAKKHQREQLRLDGDLLFSPIQKFFNLRGSSNTINDRTLINRAIDLQLWYNSIREPRLPQPAGFGELILTRDRFIWGILYRLFPTVRHANGQVDRYISSDFLSPVVGTAFGKLTWFITQSLKHDPSTELRLKKYETIFCVAKSLSDPAESRLLDEYFENWLLPGFRLEWNSSMWPDWSVSDDRNG